MKITILDTQPGEEDEIIVKCSCFDEIEEILDPDSFFRANKAVIVNINKIKTLTPAFGGRFEAVLKNGYRVIISRQACLAGKA